MKSATTISLLALAAAPISAWPWQRRAPKSDQLDSYPYHYTRHHQRHSTVAPFPYTGVSNGPFPTGTGTGFLPTGTGAIGTGLPSAPLPILPIPSCVGHICPLGHGPYVSKRDYDSNKYRRSRPHGGPHTGTESPYFPTDSHLPHGGPTGVTGTGFNPFPTATGAFPSNPIIIDSSPIASPTATSTGVVSTSTKTPSTPGNFLQKNGISIGWLPEAVSDFSTITSNLGKPGCYIGQYSQITSTTYDDSQLTQVSVNDLQGAIFIASVQPWIPFTQIDSNVASQVAASMKKFTDQGVEVYLRFGHEMNWYSTPEGKDYHGTASEFVTAWKNIAAAVADNDKVSMFWSPNNAGGDSSSLNQWWPGPETVDVVGIDIYPTSHVSFAGAYKDFHDNFAAKYDKPFVIGETGYSSSSDEDKTYWLQQLSSTEAKSQLEKYQGFSWFEYNKEQNFYVASHGDGVAKEVLG